MIQQLIQLLIYVIVFAIAAYGLYWCCVKFKMPDPAFWICGALLIIVILLFISGQISAPAMLQIHR